MAKNVAVLVGSLRAGSYNRMAAIALAALAPREERVLLAAEDGREVRDDLLELVRVGAGGERGVLGALELRCSDELHRAGDLLDVLDGADPSPDVALAGHAALDSFGASLREEALAEGLDRLVDLVDHTHESLVLVRSAE